MIDCGYEVDSGQQVVHPAWTAFYDNVGCLIEAGTLLEEAEVEEEERVESQEVDSCG